MPKSKLKLELETALREHRLWKSRLIADADQGCTTLIPEVVAEDKRCAMGRWIYESASAPLRSDPRFSRMQLVHTSFHLSASRVVRMIRTGRWEEAKAEMEHGDYSVLTMQLVTMLAQWIESLDEAPRHRPAKSADGEVGRTTSKWANMISSTGLIIRQRQRNWNI